MNILLSTDNNYTVPTGVLMTSIGINNPICNYHILVDRNFSEENRQLLTSVAQSYSSTIAFYVLPEKLLEDLPFGKDDMPKHVSLATYYRLFVTEFLPEDIHKILYLDGDIIVRKNIEQLWNEDISGYALGAVHDIDEKVNFSTWKLPYSTSEGYFNAGVLLINLDYWREYNCKEQFLNFIRDHGDVIRLHDQDVLNSVFHDKKKWLPVEYNFQHGFILRYPVYSEELRNEVDAIKHLPSIIHYTYGKPWDRYCSHPMRNVWHYYKKLSLMSGARIIPKPNTLPLKERLKLLIRKYNYYIPFIPRNYHERIMLSK